MFSATIISAFHLCQWVAKPCKYMKKFSLQKPGMSEEGHEKGEFSGSVPENFTMHTW